MKEIQRLLMGSLYETSAGFPVSPDMSETYTFIFLYIIIILIRHTGKMTKVSYITVNVKARLVSAVREHVYFTLAAGRFNQVTK